MNTLERHKALTAVRAEAYAGLFGGSPTTVSTLYSRFIRSM